MSNQSMRTQEQREDVEGEIDALATYVQALERMPPLAREAQIRWLVSKYAESTFGLRYRHD